jgi:hypothetical protein
MEYLEGYDTLREFLNKNGLLHLGDDPLGKDYVNNENKKYFDLVIFELAKLHSMGYIHNDLNLGNIMINGSEDYIGSYNGRVKLIDFGLSTEYSQGIETGKIYDLYINPKDDDHGKKCVCYSDEDLGWNKGYCTFIDSIIMCERIPPDVHHFLMHYIRQSYEEKKNLQEKIYNMALHRFDIYNKYSKSLERIINHIDPNENPTISDSTSSDATGDSSTSSDATGKNSPPTGVNGKSSTSSDATGKNSTSSDATGKNSPPTGATRDSSTSSDATGKNSGKNKNKSLPPWRPVGSKVHWEKTGSTRKGKDGQTRKGKDGQTRKGKGGQTRKGKGRQTRKRKGGRLKNPMKSKTYKKRKNNRKKQQKEM